MVNNQQLFYIVLPAMRKRRNNLNIRLSDAEYWLLKQEAEANNVSVSELARKKLADRKFYLQSTLYQALEMVVDARMQAAMEPNNEYRAEVARGLERETEACIDWYNELMSNPAINVDEALADKPSSSCSASPEFEEPKTREQVEAEVEKLQAVLERFV